MYRGFYGWPQSSICFPLPPLYEKAGDPVNVLAGMNEYGDK